MKSNTIEAQTSTNIYRYVRTHALTHMEKKKNTHTHTHTHQTTHTLTHTHTRTYYAHTHTTHTKEERKHTHSVRAKKWEVINRTARFCGPPKKKEIIHAHTHTYSVRKPPSLLLQKKNKYNNA